jgi:hypothetical protein
LIKILKFIWFRVEISKLKYSIICLKTFSVFEIGKHLKTYKDTTKIINNETLVGKQAKISLIISMLTGDLGIKTLHVS